MPVADAPPVPGAAFAADASVIAGTLASAAQPAIRVADAAAAGGLRRALRRSQRREQWRAAALVLPLFVFLLATFIVPIGAMLARGIIDNEVAQLLPRVTTELARWD